MLVFVDEAGDPGLKLDKGSSKYICSLVFQNTKRYLDQAIVIFDGSGSKDFRRSLQRYLKQKINDKNIGYSYISKVKIQDSVKNNLIQMADMICGAVARSFKSNHKNDWQYRNLIRHREIYVQFWPTNKKSRSYPLCGTHTNAGDNSDLD